MSDIDTKYATYVSYPVTVTRWRVECDCSAPEGRIECKSENEVKGNLMHHISQSEHLEWQGDHDGRK